jgi:hypothetical protein
LSKRRRKTVTRQAQQKEQHYGYSQQLHSHPLIFESRNPDPHLKAHSITICFSSPRSKLSKSG